MSKDWEIFTDKDIRDITEATKEYGAYYGNAVAHNILEERGQLGYCQVSDYGITTTKISNNQHTNDTHQALVYLRPIKDAVVECEHETSFMGCIEASGGWIKLDGRIRKSDFCPKCGADLR